MADVATLQISSPSRFREFAYTVNATNEGQQKFIGPRTILNRLAVGTAANGEIVQLTTPFTNATYEQSFSAPLIRCQDANSTIAKQIDAVAQKRKEKLDPSILEVSNDYFAFVPAINSSDSQNASIQEADLSSQKGATHAYNQLWLRFQTSSETEDRSNVTSQRSMRYLLCEMQNASYHVNFTWVNGKQFFEVLHLDTIGTVPYPSSVSYSDSDAVNLAYSAFMWSLSSQIVGYLSFHQDIDSGNDMATDVNAGRIYSEIGTNLALTSLLGSSDLDSYFVKNHALGAKDGKPAEAHSPQRLHDTVFARNRTLDVMIQELSFNITMSLLSNPNFA